MNPTQLVEQVKGKFDAAKAHFEEQVKKLRTGRAHPSMLDGVLVEAYGTQMPLNQTATISTPEPQLIQISPFDPNNLEAITTAIRNNRSLGMNPMDDGHVVRLQIPPLTEERRREIAKQLGQKVEESMIAMRNARHEGLRELDQAKKDKDIGEDEHKRVMKQIDDLMAKTKSDIESAAKVKEQEILTV